MKRWILLALLSAQFFPSCLALPQPEEIFHSRSNISARLPIDPQSKLEIWIPYVGQGDATLLIFPDGKTLLIDAGPPGAGKTFLLPLLEKLQIKVIDALIVTHYHLDHLGGVSELPAGKDGIANTDDDIRILSVYDRGGEPWDESSGYGKYLGTLEEWEIPRRTLSAGQMLTLDAHATVSCVAANGTVSKGSEGSISVDISPPAYAGRENAASIALLVEFGDFRYLTAGDITGGGMADGFLTPDLETSLAEMVGKVDALHVNHHGSSSSSNEVFAAGTKPLMAFIQSGESNPYGHPHAKVLDSWIDGGAKVYVTEEGKDFQLIAQPEGGFVLNPES